MLIDLPLTGRYTAESGRWDGRVVNDRIWTPPHCKHAVDGSHGTTAYVYSASVVGIR